MSYWTRRYNPARKLRRSLLLMGAVLLLWGSPAKGQPLVPEGSVDLFMGVDLNYRDLLHNKVYEVLVNLTPGVKWHVGRQWQVAAQALIPVYNDYGDRYKRIRLNMALLSKEFYFKERYFLKVSGGLFGSERYGLDLKGMLVVNDWLAFEAQAGLTGYCSMATGWEASRPGRVTALVGADFYLNRWNTQFRARGGRFLYEDYGVVGECMRHFKHCSVGLFGSYSDRWGENGGFKVVVMIPPYRRTRRTVNVRPASNFRLTNNIMADPYANRMYTTDPEENEREGWFDRDRLRWGSNRMAPDFQIREKAGKEVTP